MSGCATTEQRSPETGTDSQQPGSETAQTDADHDRGGTAVCIGAYGSSLLDITVNVSTAAVTP